MFTNFKKFEYSYTYLQYILMTEVEKKDILQKNACFRYINNNDLLDFPKLTKGQWILLLLESELPLIFYPVDYWRNALDLYNLLKEN